MKYLKSDLEGGGRFHKNLIRFLYKINCKTGRFHEKKKNYRTAILF